MKWGQLVSGANRVQNNYVDQTNSIWKVTSFYTPGVKTMTYNFTIIGSSPRHKVHTASIVFLRIEEIKVDSEEEALEALADGDNILVKDTYGHKHIIRKPTLYDDVQCRCSCESFRFSFAYADRKNRVMTGANFPVYIRKTPLPPRGRPRRNPHGIPGVDKHLMLAMQFLASNDFMVDE